MCKGILATMQLQLHCSGFHGSKDMQELCQTAKQPKIGATNWRYQYQESPYHESPDPTGL